MKYTLCLTLFAAGLTLSGCGALAPAAEPPTPTRFPTTLPDGITPTPVAASGGLPARDIPLTPSGLALTGRLVYTEGPLGITGLDLATGRASVIYQPPTNGVVNSAAVSPDGTHIAAAYGPPPAPGKVQMGYTGLYLLPTDGSAPPQSLVPNQGPQDFYFNPAWSPDGRYIYYGHFVSPGAQSAGIAGLLLERMAYPGGQTQVLTQNGLVPHLWPDGSKMAFISVDTGSGLNNLRIAGADGSNPADLLPGGNTLILDALAISPDGQWIVFSQGNPQSFPTPQSSSWLDGLMALGAGTAQAHNVPSDLWKMPAGGGQPQQLTHLGLTGFSPAFSPDGQHIAFLCVGGIYIMNADGSGLVHLVDGPAVGTLQWMP